MHYILTRQRGLALWQESGGEQLAGFAAWQGRKCAVPDRLDALSGDPNVLVHINALKGGRQQSLAEALAAIFDHAGGPIEFDELVAVLAALLGLRARPAESLDDEESGFARQPASTEPDPSLRAEKRIFL